MDKKKYILYIGNFSFPFGNASGKRVYANGKILKDLGYEVIFIGMNKKVRSSELLKNTQREYDGFTYYNLPYPKRNIDWIKYNKIFKKVINILNTEQIKDKLQLVIFYGSPTISLFNMKLIRYCKINNIKILSDCVDWLTVRTNNLIFNIVKWTDNTYQKAYVNKKADGIITISSYLSKYYKKNGCKTIIIPPLSAIDYSIFSLEPIYHDKKILTYAGLPFRKGQQVKDLRTLKDRIDLTIKLLYEVKKEGCKFVFNIYGFTKEDYMLAIPEQKLYVEKLEENIIFHGMKPNEEVISSIINSDFTVLIRDVNKDTSAGFPTKASESISCGTPVITTNTSDLDKYIVEGENGFFLNFDENIARKQLVNILAKTNEEVLLMKKHCIENNPFLYLKYKNILEEFLNNIL
ncbi:MAG: glycosyltransferase [Bacilli bacterium]|nr:glycosyltransferase [Bacilli bacterium]